MSIFDAVAMGLAFYYEKKIRAIMTRRESQFFDEDAVHRKNLFPSS